MPDVTEEEIQIKRLSDLAKLAISTGDNSDLNDEIQKLGLHQRAYLIRHYTLENERLRKSSHSVSQCCPMSERLQKRVEELEKLLEAMVAQVHVWDKYQSRACITFPDARLNHGKYNIPEYPNDLMRLRAAAEAALAERKEVHK